MNRILFVCHGNICRSPMAEKILQHALAKDDSRALSAVAPGSSRSVVIIDPKRRGGPSQSIIDGNQKALEEMEQPVGEQETGSISDGPPAREIDPERRVRVIGPKFLPDQSEAIDLRAPVPSATR